MEELNNYWTGRKEPPKPRKIKELSSYNKDILFDTILDNIGYNKTENQDQADCYILNTCHIRDKAKEKVYHEIGRVKKLYRDKKKTNNGCCGLCCTS